MSLRRLRTTATGKAKAAMAEETALKAEAPTKPPLWVFFQKAGKRPGFVVLGTDHIGRGTGGTSPAVLYAFCLGFCLQPVIAAWLWLWGGAADIIGKDAPDDHELRGAISVAMLAWIALKNSTNFLKNVGGRITIGIDSAIFVQVFIFSMQFSTALVAHSFSEPPEWVPYLALGIFMVFSPLEFLADEQLAAFCKAKQVPGYSGPKVMTKGLWSLTRHPNFVANTFYYSWGLILMSGTWWLSTIFTVVFVATYYLQAIPGHELHMAKKYGGEWEEYVKTTPKYIPGFGH